MPAPSPEPSRGLVRPGFGETLPALLQRTRGIAPRITVGVIAALLVLLGVAVLVLRDPYDGNTQLVHDSKPVFNLLYGGGLKVAAPEGDEAARLLGRRGEVEVGVTVRPFELPAYRGDVSGVLPIVMTNRARSLAGSLAGFRQTADGKGRISKAPGYQVEFTYGSRARPGYGLDVLIVAPETPRATQGLLISLRQTRGAKRPPVPGRELTKAARSALRSVRFGRDTTYP